MKGVINRVGFIYTLFFKIRYFRFNAVVQAVAPGKERTGMSFEVPLVDHLNVKEVVIGLDQVKGENFKLINIRIDAGNLKRSVEGIERDNGENEDERGEKQKTGHHPAADGVYFKQLEHRAPGFATELQISAVCRNP